MPVMKTHHKTRASETYRHESPKNNRVIDCMSGLEHGFALISEYAINIVAIEEQPEKFRVPADPKPFYAIPDFKVTLDTGEVEYVEVKPSRQAEKKKKRLDAIKEHITSLGFNYKVMTEKEIRRSDMLLQNCLFLKAFRSRSNNSVSALLNMVPDCPVTFGKWAKYIGDRNALVEMIAHQLVYIDLYQPITDDSVIRPLKGGDYESLYY